MIRAAGIDPAEIIDRIERFRAKNNKNWMDLLRLSFKLSPGKTSAILARILAQDDEISRLANLLMLFSESGEITITMRGAAAQDAGLVFAWRNDPESRRMSLSGEAITYEAHLSWFQSAVADQKKVILIGSLAQENIGMVRFDARPDSGSDRDHGLMKNGVNVSIIVDPRFRGIGLGGKLLQAGIAEYSAEYSGILVAEVKPGNKGSLRIFRDLDFKPLKATDHLITLSLAL